MTVILEAVHAVKPLTNTAFDRWVDLYGEIVVPAMARSGYGLLGGFKRTGGPMNEDVLLARFENLAAVEAASDALRRDPAMAKLRERMEGLSIQETVNIGTAVPYATDARLEAQLAAKPDAPRQYMQAVLGLVSGGQPKAFELVGKLADWAEGAGALNLTTAYESRFGRRGVLTDIWVMPNGIRSFDYRPGDPLAEIIAPLREVAPDESIYYLNPLPYSPLQ